MFAYIQGSLTYKSPTNVIIEANGVGYDINISLQTYSKIQKLDECLLHTYFHVKEDGQTLYGFADKQEKEIFIQLISVSGIGPNTARMMLSSLEPQEIQRAILQENVAVIEGVKGIGPKSAKRLILELKDKVGKIVEPSTISEPSYNTLKEEALSALVMLGFSKPVAERAVSNVMKTQDEDTSVEELIKLALKNM